MQNIAIVSPEPTTVSTPSIDDSEAQGTLHLGPTGVVHKSTLPDNRAFWESVNAVEFASRGSSRREVYRAVAYFASLTDARVCFASVATLAKRASLGTTATRSQLRALERDGYIETDGSRSGGRSATRYRLSTQRVSVPNPTLSVAQPNAYRWVNPTLTVAEEVKEEGTEEEVQAAASDPGTYRQPGEIAKPAPLPALSESQKAETTTPEKAVTSEATRHVCQKCGNTWPKKYEPVCFKCQTRIGASHPAGLAAPVPGKYDDLEDGERRPRTGRIQTEYAARFASAHPKKTGRRKYQRIDGTWSELPAVAGM